MRRLMSIFLFISHCRLRSDKNDNGYNFAPHPDTPGNDKYQLCVAGIQHLYNDLIDTSRIKGCYLWIDFVCVDQTVPHSLSLDYKNMEEIMRVSDCLFTPVFDPDNTLKELSISKQGGYLKDYKVPDWTGTEYSNRGYLKRGWCLLEMFYGVSE